MNPKLPSTSSRLCSRSGAGLTHSTLPRECSKPDLQMGHSIQWEDSSQFVCWKHRHIQTTETENPALFIEQSPVSTGSEEDLQCCLLQALPCPTPVWTSGRKHVRAAPERHMSPESTQDSQEEGTYRGFASKVHSLLYQSTTVDNLQMLMFKGKEGNLLSRKQWNFLFGLKY